MKDYKKYYLLSASPDEVYEALTKANTIEMWTGETAEMSQNSGTEFSLWDGSIVGKNLEFDPGKKIVQHWYFGEQSPASIVTLVLHPHKQGTSVELIHTNIPDEDYEDIVQGWNESYFGSLQEFYS